jgi:hypothetical protein
MVINTIVQDYNRLTLATVYVPQLLLLTDLQLTNVHDP